MSFARNERGFTTIELLLAVMLMSVGMIALIGTLDVSRRTTTLSEMKEAASHVAEQNIEQVRTISYSKLALDGTPTNSTDPKNPNYYVGGDSSGPTYRWNQKADAPTPHTEPLVIDTTNGRVPVAPSTWSDGRLSGMVYRYVTAVTDPNCDETRCPGTDYKRVTIAVTVNGGLGPSKPILVTATMADPNAAIGGGIVNGDVNPLKNPSTKCVVNGVLSECKNSIDGAVSAFYLYDTPATSSTRQEIAGSHATHPTVAPSGTCSGTTTSGCPVPDLMGLSPPPSSTTTPPLYTYSNEITGGTWPGGAVVRRDTACDGTPTSTDNTKGHMWVTAPLSAPMTLTGDASLSLSTSTFNAVTAEVTICVRFYNVPGSLTNLVATPPTALGTDNYTQSTWPKSATSLGFSMDFRGSSADVTIPSGNRLGVRVWATASSGADIALLYDHPLHGSFVQVNEAG